MGKYVQWITHKGVRILFLNGKDLTEAEYLAALEEMKQEVLKDRSGPLSLVDLSNTSVTQKTANKGKELAAATKAAGIPDGPGAVVGLSKTARMVAQIFARDSHYRESHYFDTIDEAKEWLVSEAKKPR